MKSELSKFKIYCDRVKAKEQTAIRSANFDGSPKIVPNKTILSELEYFLEKQEVKKTLMPLFNQMSRVHDCEVPIEPQGQKCPRLPVNILFLIFVYCPNSTILIIMLC